MNKDPSQGQLDMPPGMVELLLGIMADGKVVESEVAMLEGWLAARPEAEGYAVRTLRHRLEQVRKKGFDCQEGKDLFQLMASLITGFLPDFNDPVLNYTHISVLLWFIGFSKP